MDLNTNINLWLKAMGAKKTSKAIEGVTNSFTQLKQVGNSIIKTTVKMDQATGKLNKTMSTTTSSIAKFNMGWLSVMFYAMRIQRIFGQLFKSMINTFREMSAKTNPLNMALTRLEASWTYLKYAIIEAMSPLLTKFVIWLAEMAVSIANMDPDRLQLIGWGILAIVGVGAMAFEISQLMLLGQGLVAIFKGSKLLGGINLSGLATKISDLANSVAGRIGIGAIGIGLGIYFFIKAWEMMTTPTDMWDRASLVLIGAMAGAGIGFMIAGPPGMLIGGIIGASIGIVISLADFLIENQDVIKTGINDLWQNMQALFEMPDIIGKMKEGSLTGDELRAFQEKIDIDAVDQYNDALNVTTTELTRMDQAIAEFAQAATPAMLSDVNRMYEEGVLPSVASAMVGGVIPSFVSWSSEMKENTIPNIERIQAELDAIPREITTIHTIITRHKSEGSKGMEDM